MLCDRGYDYWALGHVHAREVLCEAPHVVFPGNLQGRHMRETGPKGATLLTVERGRLRDVRHEVLDAVRFASCEVDLGEAADGHDAVELARAALAREVAQAGGRLLAARVVFVGRSRAHAQLAADLEHWTEQVRAAALDADGAVWLENVQLRTRGELDVAARSRRAATRSASSPRGCSRSRPIRRRSREWCAALAGELKLPREALIGEDGLNLAGPRVHRRAPARGARAAPVAAARRGGRVRLLELSLLAYGAFRDRRFDLSAPPPAMHVLYGANEAGKSTALRAILGLLYGIDRRTPDAYLHGNANLRIGARLCDAAGRELQVVRRKGDKDTLLDAHGAVLDEMQLQRLLGGMQEGVFRSMFGLDHARLRKGGEQLRLGQGDLGESLFQAGVGAPGLSVVLRALSAQADELFRPRGKRLLNGEIDAFRKAQRAHLRARQARGEPAPAGAGARRGGGAALGAAARRNELLEEQGRLARVKRVLPKLAQRRELLERRAQLGEQPLLPDDSDEQRRKAQAERFACESQLVQLERAHAGATQRSAALVIPEGLLELSADYVRAIRNRLGGILKAEEDLPSRRAELRALEHDARAALRALGRTR